MPDNEEKIMWSAGMSVRDYKTDTMVHWVLQEEAEKKIRELQAELNKLAETIYQKKG